MLFWTTRGLLGATVVLAAIGATYANVSARELWEATRNAPLASFIAPQDALLRFEIGNYYFGGLPGRGGAYDITKAEKYYREARKIDPTLPGLHYQLARIHFIRGDFYLAEEEINKELELHPDFKRSYYVRALIYGYSKRLPEAESDFKEFLKWNPDSWAANNDLAWIYFGQGKYAEAVSAARAGLLATPDNPWLLNSLGVGLLNVGDTRGAQEAFDKALKVIASMSESDWGAAYPGNNPRVYSTGFLQMKTSIEANRTLLGIGDTAGSP